MIRLSPIAIIERVVRAGDSAEEVLVELHDGEAAVLFYADAVFNLDPPIGSV